MLSGWWRGGWSQRMARPPGTATHLMEGEREREIIPSHIGTCSEIIVQHLWLKLRSSMIITVLLVVILGFSGVPELTALARVGLDVP